MKKKVLFTLSFIIAFILGFVLCVLLYPNENKSTSDYLNDELIALFEKENELLYYNIEDILLASESLDADTTCHATYLIKKADSLLIYFRNVLSSEDKYKKFSNSELNKIVKSDFNFDDFNKITAKIKIDELSLKEVKLYISVCENILINRYLNEYKKSSLMIKNAKCIIVSDKDTLNLGENYSGQIYFTINDLTIREKIRMNNGVKIKDGFYVEKTTKRGLNKRTGIYEWFNGSGSKWFPIEFSFYVK